MENIPANTGPLRAKMLQEVYIYKIARKKRTNLAAVVGFDLFLPSLIQSMIECKIA